MFLNSSCKRKWKRRTWTRFKCSSIKRHYPLSSSLWPFHSTRAHTPSIRSSICKSRSSNGSAFSELAPCFSSLLSASIQSLVFRLRSRKLHSDYILSHNTWNSKFWFLNPVITCFGSSNSPYSANSRLYSDLSIWDRVRKDSTTILVFYW